MRTPWQTAEEVLKILREILAALRDVAKKLEGVREDLAELKAAMKTRPK